MTTDAAEEAVAAAPSQPPLTTTVSIKPAMTVVVVAALTLLAFGIVDVTTSQSVAPPTTIAVVGGLSVQSESSVMTACLNSAPVPSNVTTGFIVPVSSHAVGGADNQADAAGGFDCSQEVTAPYPQSEILGFYQSQFHALGWSLFSQGTSRSGGTEDLFEIAGNDTFYWEAGVIIDHSSTTSTSWTLNIFQNNAID